MDVLKERSMMEAKIKVVLGREEKRIVFEWKVEGTEVVNTYYELQLIKESGQTLIFWDNP